MWNGHFITLKRYRSSHRIYLKICLFSNIHRKTLLLEFISNSEHCKIFNSTYFEEHLRTSASENTLMRLRKTKTCSPKKLSFLKIFLFISWLVSIGVFIHIQYFLDMVRKNSKQYLLELIKRRSKVQEKNVMWTCFKFWPMKNIFWKL